LFALLLFSASDAVHKCEVKEKQRSHKERPDPRGEWRERVYRRFVVNARCGGSADDVWAALSGLAVAGFTFTLWRSTKSLVDSAELQRIANEQSATQQALLVNQQILIAKAQTAISEQQTKILDQQVKFSVITQRAHLFVNQPTATVMILSNERKFLIEIIFNYINTSATTAKNVRVWTNCKLFHSFVPIDFDYPAPGSGWNPIPAIGSGKGFTAARFNGPEDLVEKLEGGRYIFLIWGRCEYEDVFPGSEKHWLNVCYKVTLGTDIFSHGFDETREIIEKNQLVGFGINAVAWTFFGCWNASD
jgi:hypothetical protein